MTTICSQRAAGERVEAQSVGYLYCASTDPRKGSVRSPIVVLTRYQPLEREEGRIAVRCGGSGALGADDRPEGADEDLEVQPERPVLDVVVVEPGPVWDGRVAPQPVDLRQAGEP